MAITVVGTASSGAGVGGSTTTTSPINTIGANCIFWFVSDYQPSGALPSSGGPSSSSPPYDNSASNVWTLLRTDTNASQALTRISIYYCKTPATSASHTFTMTKTSDFISQYIIALSGVDLTGFVDQQTGTATVGAATVSSFQPGSVTPSTNGQIVITGCSEQYITTPVVPTVPADYTAVALAGTSNHIGGGLAYKIKTDLLAENPTWTYGGLTKTSVNIITVKAISTVNNNGNFFSFFG